MPYEIYFEVADKPAQKDEEGNEIEETLEPINDTNPLYTKNPTNVMMKPIKNSIERPLWTLKSLYSGYI